LHGIVFLCGNAWNKALVLLNSIPNRIVYFYL
jgi:hypothetical protein